MPPEAPCRTRRRALALLLLPVSALHALVLRPLPQVPPTGLQAPPGLAVRWLDPPAPAAPPAPPTAVARSPTPMPMPMLTGALPQPGPGVMPGPKAGAKAAAQPPAQAPVLPAPIPTAAHGPAQQPTPVYRTQPPAPVRLQYLLQAPQGRALATLDWQRQGERYRLVLDTQALEPGAAALNGAGAASQGQLGGPGLVPERFVERRQGRDRRAANFDAAGQQVRGSGGGPAWPFPPGGQDRLSWLIQLAAVLQAEPALGLPGQQLVLPVSGPREATAAWVFEVQGLQWLELADGSRRKALALLRRPLQPYDLAVQVWLDPQQQHLPLAWELAAPPGAWRSRWTLWPPAAAGELAAPASPGA